MATIQNANIARGLLQSRGYEDGLQWNLIFQYEGLNGETLFAFFTEARHCDIYQSPYVKNPVLLMENGCLTDEGAEFLFGADWAGQIDEFNSDSETEPD